MNKHFKISVMVGFVWLWDLSDGRVCSFVPLQDFKTVGFVPYEISKMVSFVLLQEFNDCRNVCNKFKKF